MPERVTVATVLELSVARVHRVPFDGAKGHALGREELVGMVHLLVEPRVLDHRLILLKRDRDRDRQGGEGCFHRLPGRASGDEQRGEGESRTQRTHHRSVCA